MAGDYIRREDARRMVVQLDKYAWKSPVSDERRVTVDVDLVKFGLDRIPAADVAQVRHGRWIDAYPDIEPNPMFMYGICSECGFEQGISKYLKYCPDCGCRMDGGADE